MTDYSFTIYLTTDSASTETTATKSVEPSIPSCSPRCVTQTPHSGDTGNHYHTNIRMNKKNVVEYIVTIHSGLMVIRRLLKCALTVGNILVAADGRLASPGRAVAAQQAASATFIPRRHVLQRSARTSRLFEMSFCFGNMLRVPELYCLRQRTVTAAPRQSGTVCVTQRGLHEGMDGSTDFVAVVSVEAESVVRYMVNE